ncbi:peptidylprolyl isomerase [Candidatus Kapabacteria bacterium]|nr:peptidylprolyl isomerase [Candidatus Kapabacteria bacterium]
MKLLILFLLITSHLLAQLKEGESLDRILAVVGTEKIMKSEIDAQMIRMLEMNQGIDFYDSKVRDQILNSLIDEKLIVVRAQEDSVTVLDAEVEARWNQLVEQWKANYGSVQRIEAVFKKSLTEVKFEYEDQIRNQLMAMKLQQTKFGVISITKSEVTTFYEDYKDSLDVIGDRYKIAHIVRKIKANTDQKNMAYKKAMAIRDSLLEGKAFEELALNNSEDPNTAADGGGLGWFDKGRLFPEFENAAFALQLGETSLPVETPFGYHLIQTITKKENSINTRHILIKIGESSDNTIKTKEFLIALKDSIINGADFGKMALRYSEDESTKGFEGIIGELTIEEMPPSYRTEVANLQENTISDPLSYQLGDGKKSLSIIKVLEFLPSHKINLERDYTIIENYAKNYKQRRLMNDWVKELRTELYWELKDD